MKAKELSDASTAVVVGTPTVFELCVGVELSIKSSEEREKILAILKSLTQLPLDTSSAIRAGLTYAGRAKEASKIDPEDAMLAWIAIENNQPLLTRNKGFSGIPDLSPGLLVEKTHSLSHPLESVRRISWPNPNPTNGPFSTPSPQALLR